MKQTKLYILGSLLASVLFVSCNDRFNPVFDKPANERLNDVFDSCRTVLTDAPNGWDMLYFINNESKGYNLLMDFSSATEVTIAGSNEITNNTYRESASTYDLNNSNGPIIAFDTYNDVLHPFADPDPNGYSMGGDFEFVIVKVSSDQIVLKGKKTGMDIVLDKITDDLSHASYLAETRAMRNELFSIGAPDYTLEVDGDSTGYVFTGGASSVFTVKDSEGKESSTHAFVTTRKGIRLCVAEEISGQNVQTFLLNDDKSALVGEGADNVRLVGPQDLAGYFTGTKVNWALDDAEMSDDFKNLYQQIVASLESKYSGVSDIYLALAGEPSKGYYSLRLGFVYRAKTVAADLYLYVQKSDHAGVTFTYQNSGNNAGIALAKSITGYSEMAALLATSYKLETDDPLTVRNINLIKSTNSATWLKVTRF